MRLLVACECSGRVRDAFAALGHDAWSCDTQPSNGQHIQGDVMDVLNDGWDAAIAHPPCTYLGVSNNGPMTHGCRLYTAEQGRELRRQAIAFFMAFAESNIPKWGIENPVGIMSTIWRRPDQIIQPYQFGDDASKKTCLWLKGFPKLMPTKRVAGRIIEWQGKQVERWSNQTDSGQNKLGPSEDRGKIRAVTYPGIAHAMAAQWGGQVIQRQLYFLDWGSHEKETSRTTARRRTHRGR